MIPEFLTYLRSIKGYSPNTIRSYEKDLHEFARWISSNYPGTRWSTITRSHIDSYIVAQETAGKKPATTNRQLSAISSLYSYLRREGNNIPNPCQYESRRKDGSKAPDTIPMTAITEAYRNTKGYVHSLLGILALTGMRIQEALNLTNSDIDIENGRIKVNGKGSKERYIDVEKSSLSITLNQYYKPNQAHSRIFPFTQRHARYIIWEAVKPYTNATKISPHVIRHSVATHMANKGESAITIAKVLGHSHIETSQKYINFSQVEKATTGITL